MGAAYDCSRLEVPLLLINYAISQLYTVSESCELLWFSILTLWN